MLHLQAARRLLIYLAATMQHEIFFPSNPGLKTVAAVGTDWGGDTDTRRYTMGFVLRKRFSVIMARKRSTSCVSIIWQS